MAQESVQKMKKDQEHRPDQWTQAALLRVGQMARADAATIAAGTPGIDLMERAGAAVAARAADLFAGRPVWVLCGPGNNGGDGFVAARILRDQGMDVRLSLLGEPGKLSGDAALAAEAWAGDVLALDAEFDPGGAGVIDALFGAGLARPLDGPASAVVQTLNQAGTEVLAVDIPSGVMGGTGEIIGGAVQAVETVTFCRRKPAHFLMPGRAACGRVQVADIGIPDAIVADQAPDTWVNSAEIWWPDFPQPGPADHKYTRGHVVIWGNSEMPGAARLAADGARRIGAGIVSIAARSEDLALFRSGAPGVLVKNASDPEIFDRFYKQPAKNQVLLVGPGNGTGNDTRNRVLTSLATGKPMVLDADGVSAFADNPAELIGALHENCVVTPHEGEFARVFPGEGDRLSRARAAARQSGAVVLLKGFDTVIAAPDGRAVINANGSPYLASAGTGDVLAGMIAGLLGQGMAPFPAAAAAVWLHSDAANTVGHGMIAEDIPALLPEVIGAMPEALLLGQAGGLFTHLSLAP